MQLYVHASVAANNTIPKFCTAPPGPAWVLHGKFYRLFLNRKSKFVGISAAFSLPFIMCGETCDDAKLAAAVDRKVDAASAIVAQYEREGGRSQILLRGHTLRTSAQRGGGGGWSKSRHSKGGCVD